MNPLLIAVLITVLIALSLVALAFVGHRLGKRLKARAPKNRAGRLLRDYRLWSVLAGLLMCGAIFGPSVHILLSVALLPLMVFAMVVADEMEPKSKCCGACGR